MYGICYTVYVGFDILKIQGGNYMSYQEKKKVTNIISSILITTIYAIVIYNLYLDGSMDASNVFRFWAIIILIFIPISIVARIIIMILFHIFDAVVETAKGNEYEEELDITDERDKRIEMKASYIGLMVFSAGFMIALATQLFDVSNHIFFITLVVAGLITDILSEALGIYFYRRGV